MYINITCDLRLEHKQMVVFFPNTMQWLRKLPICLSLLNFSRVLKVIFQPSSRGMCVAECLCSP